MRALNKQNGETIVEVLISMAVLGLILSASYALANKSTQANRQAQERAEALNENSTRVEQFKTFLENEGDVPSGYFCIYEDDIGELKADGSFPAGTPSADTQNDNLDAYPDNCKAGTDNRYSTAIDRVNNANDTTTYIFTTRWFRVAGGGTEELLTQYKTYKESELSWKDVFEEPPDGPIDLPSPECSNGINDDSEEDDAVDYPADTGCVNADDDSESPNPLTQFTFNGSDFYTCLNRSGGDCWTSGNSVFSCIEYTASYAMGSITGVQGGNYNLTIYYSNGNDGQCATDAPPDPADINYSFSVEIIVDNEERATVNLPIIKDGNIRDNKSNPINIGRIEPESIIELSWTNDYWCGDATCDANFQIDKITLDRIISN